MPASRKWSSEKTTLVHTRRKLVGAAALPLRGMKHPGHPDRSPSMPTAPLQWSESRSPWQCATHLQKESGVDEGKQAANTTAGFLDADRCSCEFDHIAMLLRWNPEHMQSVEHCPVTPFCRLRAQIRRARS